MHHARLPLLTAAIALLLVSPAIYLLLVPPDLALSQTTVLVIRDDATGGDCESVGAWDRQSRTCTLDRDLHQQIVIDSDGITLDGNGHRMSGSGPDDPSHYVFGRDGGGDAINLYNRTGVTVRGISISRFDYGIRLEHSDGNVIEDNDTYLMGLSGISLHHSTGNVISGNDLSNPGISSGICIGFSSSRNEISSNRFSGNERGAYVHTNSNSNKFIDNEFLKNVRGITIIDGSIGGGYTNNRWTENRYGISIQDGSSQNTFSGNTISANETGVFISNAIDNTFYHNIFRSNNLQVAGAGGGNFFTLPKPSGGNYWSVFDEPEEGCRDVNEDGFCDAAFISAGVMDDLPATCRGGWSCNHPAQASSLKTHFWQTLSSRDTLKLTVESGFGSLKG